VLLSCAVSVDGHLDDRTARRLLLSGPEDLDRVDEVRSGQDAILIGATTLRRDNPRLLVNSAARRAAREARGLPAFPLRVVLTRGGDLAPGLRFWHTGGARLVYCPERVAGRVRERLGDLAEVVALPGDPDPATVADDLGGRGVRRLMVEGGQSVLTAFLTAAVADELHLAVAPFFVGDPQAPRFVGGGSFPHGPGHPMELAGVEAVGGVALLRFRLAADPASGPAPDRRPDA
jgi:5-amino-6-(5-phosphoribosylamino)uracil reductase